MMQTKKFKIVISYILIISLIFLCSGCAKSKDKESSKDLTAKDLIEPKASHDTSVKAFYGDIANAEVMDARVSPLIKYLTFDKPVIFGEYSVQIGDVVKKGDIIAKSYTADTETTLKELKKQLQNMKDKHSYEQTSKGYQLSVLKYQLQSINKKSMKEQYISKKSEIERIELSITQSADMEKIEEEHLNQQIADLSNNNTAYTIKAPFDGEIVSLLDIRQGDQVSTAANVVALADNSRSIIQTKYIEENVLSQYLRIFAFINGKEYEIKYSPYNNTEYKNLIAAGEIPVGNFEFKDPGNEGLIGSYAAIVLYKEDHKHVLCVPNASINTDSVGNYIFKIENEKRVRYDVKIGITDGLYTEIISGVKEGDNVYSRDNNVSNEFSDQAVVKTDFSKEFQQDGEKVWMNEKVFTFDTQGTNFVFNSYAVKENEVVKAGQAIAYVIPTKDEVTLVENQFELNALKKKIENLEEVFNKNLNLMTDEKRKLTSDNEKQIKSSQINQLKLDYQYQKSELYKQQTDLELIIEKLSAMAKVSKIVAKEDCIITKLGQLTKGDQIQPNSIIVKTANINDFYIAVDDTEGLLTYKQKVSIDDGKKKTTGTVVTTWKASLPLSLQNQKALIRVADTNSIEHELVNVITKASVMNQVYLVDRSYIYINESNSYVKGKDKDGNIVSKVFIPGGYNDQYCWAVSGLLDNLKLMKNTDK